jgi:protein-S-isoprenylcysteine O-methyltransferase Ste14
MRLRTLFLATAFQIVLGVILFLVAGTSHLPAVWAYLGIQWVFTLASVLAMSESTASERLKPGTGAKKEPVYDIGAAILWITHFVIAMLDIGRFQWSAGFPAWLEWLGGIGALAAYALPVWALRHNEFMSARIRIQKDRGQRVIDTGPYALIRHPNYAGGMLHGILGGLLLGSWPALIPMLLWCGLLVTRTLNEEKLLLAELDGYREYTQRVRFRFFPGVF